MNAKRLPRKQAGNILLLSVIAMVPVAALVTVSLNTLTMKSKELEARRATIRAENESLSTIEMAKAAIVAATYDQPGLAGRNSFLGAALQTTVLSNANMKNGNHLCLDTATGEKVWRTGSPWSNVQVVGIAPLFRAGSYQPPGSTEDADVWIVQLTDSWTMLETSVEVQGIRRTARSLVREFDTFSRYSIFTDSIDSQPISVRTSGDVHSNRGLTFFHGGWDLPGYVSAVDGFGWSHSADWSNVGFQGGYNESADRIDLPSLSEISDRMRPPVGTTKGSSVGSDYIYIGSDFNDCKIAFDRTRGLVEARRKSDGKWETVYDGFLFDIRRIYVVPGISSLGGDIDGSMSIASESDDGITITDNLRYIDSNGEYPFIDVGATNTPNPDYRGDAVLGIIAAKGSVIYSKSVPKTLEVHGSIFTSKQQTIEGLKTKGNTNQAEDYDNEFQKDYLLTFGATTAGAGKLRGVVDSKGNTKSGFSNGAYLFDETLSRNPPPYFVRIDRSVFGGTHIVEALSDI